MWHFASPNILLLRVVMNMSRASLSSTLAGAATAVSLAALTGCSGATDDPAASSDAQTAATRRLGPNGACSFFVRTPAQMKATPEAAILCRTEDKDSAACTCGDDELRRTWSSPAYANIPVGMRGQVRFIWEAKRSDSVLTPSTLKYFNTGTKSEAAKRGLGTTGMHVQQVGFWFDKNQDATHNLSDKRVACVHHNNLNHLSMRITDHDYDQFEIAVQNSYVKSKGETKDYPWSAPLGGRAGAVFMAKIEALRGSIVLPKADQDKAPTRLVCETL